MMRIPAWAFARLTAAALLALPLLTHAAPPAGRAAPFRLAAHLPVDGVAEIVAATPDGMTLLFTSADAGRVGVVDIRQPDRPALKDWIDVRLHGVGEPTSVAVTPDGRFAVVAIRMDDDQHNARRGLLRIYDVRRPEQVRHVKDITVGVGPDSLALAGQGRTLRAVVAIEDEETNAKGDALLGGQRPGFIEVVGLQTLYGGRDSGLQRMDLVDALRSTDGVLYAHDPQPEFVSISPSGRRAAVSLQENNAIAIVDLSDARRARLERVFSAGIVERQGNADLAKDKEVRLKDSFRGRREPDAISWVNDNVLALANEGDGKKDENGSLPGGRGFTLMDARGRVVHEDNGALEAIAVRHGHYPDGRSAAKGIETEAITAARFGKTPYLFVGSERGSFVAAYQINRLDKPEFVQLLPTGQSPEGLTTVTRRRDGQQLVVTANEGDGSIQIYRHDPGAPVREPQLLSASVDVPWGAISGLTQDGRHLYAVPDNAFGQSRIWRIDPNPGTPGQWTIDQTIAIRTADGRAVKADPEGIAHVPEGFWIASEGAKVADNALLLVDREGVVRQQVSLPPSVQSRFARAGISTGFEGVAASPDGQTLYLAIQRGFDPEKPQAAIVRWHRPTDTWTTALYPLERHSRDPKTFWMGISEIQLLPDGRLLVLERDKGGGEARAINAEVKRIYSVRVGDIEEGAVLAKQLVRDLRQDHNYLQEKAEGMVVFRDELWVVNDNDGAGWTRWLPLGRP